MIGIHCELDVVVVRKIILPTRSVAGTDRVLRQPRIGDQATVVQILDAQHRVVECVDSSGCTVWLAEFHLDELAPFPELWTFRTDETSAGVYRAIGTGPRNMQVESIDTDPDKALADCRQFALRYPE